MNKVLNETTIILAHISLLFVDPEYGVEFYNTLQDSGFNFKELFSVVLLVPQFFPIGLLEIVLSNCRHFLEVTVLNKL